MVLHFQTDLYIRGPSPISTLSHHTVSEIKHTTRVPTTLRGEIQYTCVSSTIGLLVSRPRTRSPKLLGLTPPGVCHEQRPVVLREDVSNLLLTGFIHVCRAGQERLVRAVVR